jgi:hypothetical protein
MSERECAKCDEAVICPLNYCKHWALTCRHPEQQSLVVITDKTGRIVECSDYKDVREVGPR